ncbi:hypothetical protein Tco_0167610 [Tanacetum coccineum]
MEGMRQKRSVLSSALIKIISFDVADVDNNPIIDKSLVMVEDTQPSISYDKEVNINHEVGASSHTEPLPMEIIDKGTISFKLHNHPTPEGKFHRRKSSGHKFSFKDPSTRNSEYAKAPQVKVNYGTSSDAEKAYVSDLEKIPEVVEKHQSKGFRRLLKLGNQNHSPSDTLSANATFDNGTFITPAPASASIEGVNVLSKRSVVMVLLVNDA